MAEFILFETDDALLFGVTPKSVVLDPETGANKYYKKHWRLNNIQWKGKLQVVKLIPNYFRDEEENINDEPEKCQLRLKELSDHTLIGMAPYDEQGNGVTMTSDSSRYFVLTLQNNGNKFDVGVAFEDPGHSTMLTEVLYKFRQEAKRPSNYDPLADMEIKDYHLKEGQTIHVNLNKDDQVKTGVAEEGSVDLQPLAPPPILPPPASTTQEYQQEEEEEDDDDDDFGDFVS